MPEHAPLYLHRLALDQVRLLELGRRRHLPSHAPDLGYLVHCQLGEMFGELAPSPFQIQGTPGRNLIVLGYGPSSMDVMLDHADAFADPGVYSALDRPKAASKQMPVAWEPGRRLGFQVRVCPVVRVSGKVASFPGAPADAKSGVETDAFITHCWWAGKDVSVDRETVYRRWLEERLVGSKAVKLLHAEMTSFQLEKVVRRDHAPMRNSGVLKRPVAEFTGEFEVQDAAAFQRLLVNGIGRHKAFGFGMVLLRSVGRAQC